MSENYNSKIDLQNLQFLITTLSREYQKLEDQPRLIKVSSVKQTEFKDLFDQTQRTNYERNELTELQGQIGHIDIYKEKVIFFI